MFDAASTPWNGTGTRHCIVLDDHARLPQRFFGRFTTTLHARLIGGR